MTETYIVTAPWTWDRRYEAGERVSMTRDQFDYFSTAMPGLLIPAAPDTKTTKKVDAE